MKTRNSFFFRVLAETLLISFILLSSCQKEIIEAGDQSLIINEEEVLVINDLSFLWTKPNANKNTNTTNRNCPDIASGEGFPINGCRDFTVGARLGGWVYIETEITVCCACTVCGIHSIDHQEQKRYTTDYEIITVEKSSSVIFKNYEISIANGSYKIDENGEILDVYYKVVKRK